MESLNINELSIEQKIGQTLIARCYISEADKDFVLKMVRNRSIGGIQVWPGPDCEALTAEIRAAADYPVLICADMEQGFPGSGDMIPSAMTLSSIGDEQLAYDFAQITAINAKKRGYSVVWGPCVDLIDRNAACKIPRIFGSDPERTCRFAEAIARGYTDNGMILSAKHFLAGADHTVDTHLTEAVSGRTREELEAYELKPYYYLMERGVLSGVMTSHTRYPNIDPEYPCTLSPKMLALLRDRGYDGLIFTDSFAMMAILQKYREEDIYGLALAAGCDLILPNLRVPFQTSYEYMLDCYKRGLYTEAQLDNAVRRVIRAQNASLKPAKYPDSLPGKDEIIRRISRDGVCAVLSDGAEAALKPVKKRLFIVQTANLYRTEGEIRGEINAEGGISEDREYPEVRDMILERFPDADVMSGSQYPGQKQIEAVSYASTKADELVFITYNLVSSYMGSEMLSDRMLALMNSVQDKIGAELHIGNPYALENLPHLPRILASFGWGDSLRYMLDALAGRYVPKGTIPVRLNLK